MYHIRLVAATAKRVLTQLLHDPRTLVLIFGVPCLLLVLLYWLFSDYEKRFDTVAPALLGVFPFVIMFIVTSITMLRERIGGTLERLMTTSIAKIDLVLGYMIAFGIVAIVQSLLASSLLLYVLDLSIQGPEWFLIATAVADALLGTALGIFVSAFARTEFQAVQFMPALIMPQILIGGLFLPLADMPDLLEKIAYYLPLTYAIDALNLVVTDIDLPDDAWRDLWIVAACMIGAVILAAATLRRKSA